jgi:hypothetical protein
MRAERGPETEARAGRRLGVPDAPANLIFKENFLRNFSSCAQTNRI